MFVCYFILKQGLWKFDVERNKFVDATSTVVNTVGAVWQVLFLRYICVRVGV